MDVNLPMYVAGLGLVLLSMIGVLVLVRRRRAAAGSARGVDAAPIEDPAPSGPAGTTDAAPVHPDLRALRAQVRVLEEALERAAEATVEQPELGSYRAQVRLALDAVARRTEADADPRGAVARVAAAIARLDADPADRVVLPAAHRPPADGPTIVAEPAPGPAREGASDTLPVTPPDAASDPVEQPVAPVTERPVEEEVVLPVPPPAPAGPHRPRRRLRRSAA